MALQAVIDAVSARLGSPWVSADSTSLQVLGPNDLSQVPTDGTPFLTIQYPLSIPADQKSIGSPGNNLWRESGAIRFVISSTANQGVQQANNWCGEIATLFRGKQFDGVNTWGPSSPLMDNSNSNGNYFLLTFAVPYYFDFFG